MLTRRGEAFFLTSINYARILSQKMLRPYQMIRGDINNVKNAGTRQPAELSTMNFTQNIQNPSLTKLTVSLPDITVSRTRNWISSSITTSNTAWDARQMSTRRGEAFFLTPINNAGILSQKMLRPYRMIRGDINNVKNAGTLRPAELSTMNFTQNIQNPSLTKLTASLPNITVSRTRNWILSSIMTSNIAWDARQMPTRRGEAFFLTPINNAGILSQKMLRPYRMIRGDINNVKNAGTMRPVGLSTMNFTQNIQKPSLTKLTASLPNITVSRIRNWILSSTMTSNTVWDAGQIPTRRGEAFFLTPINYARTFSQKMLRPYNKTQ